MLMPIQDSADAVFSGDEENAILNALFGAFHSSEGASAIDLKQILAFGFDVLNLNDTTRCYMNFLTEGTKFNVSAIRWVSFDFDGSFDPNWIEFSLDIDVQVGKVIRRGTSLFERILDCIKLSDL